MDVDHPLRTALPPTRFKRWLALVRREATFFRLHLAAFTFIPLIASGIFHASNSKSATTAAEGRVSFIDAVFLCYSSMTVTGLSTINLSTITPWQQVILYLLMTLGDISLVSWIMVLVRLSYFRSKCEYVARDHVSRFPDRRAILASISSPIKVFKARQSISVPAQHTETNGYSNGNSALPTPGFNVTAPTPGATLVGPAPLGKRRTREASMLSEKLNEKKKDEEASRLPIITDAITSSPETASILLPPENDEKPRLSIPTSNPPTGLDLSGVTSPVHSPRVVGFAGTTGFHPPRTGTRPLGSRRSTHRSLPNSGVSRSNTHISRSGTILSGQERARVDDQTSIPGLVSIIRRLLSRLIHRTSPKLHRSLTRSFTMPITQTLEPEATPWLSFNLTIGKNSDFHTNGLSEEQLEEIGGTEYAALRLLSWAVPLYFILSQLATFVFFAPWLSTTSEYDEVFASQSKLVNKTWFSLFQVMSAYTGGGLSLVDLAMLPFQKAYLMVFGLIFVILAGNHALPIFLRFMIWVGSRLVRQGSDLEKAFSFLLAHPRRCFIYLFPSHQTWFLLICLIAFSAIEWVSFEVLNIGLPVYNAMDTSTRVVAGLFQGLAARASGFAIVPVASLAPALQFLYVVMMYIAIYPVALVVRSTNVYEERSLGVFEDPMEMDYEEPNFADGDLDVRERIGRYLGWHVRRQLSIDIWWLIYSIFIIAIVERNNLLDEDKKWFDLFRVIFELVSAFGGIGLSLGVPYDNFSFVGSMKPLSKLVIIVIMVRGRHRGLPVAVDRAVLLPHELRLQARITNQRKRTDEPQPFSAP